MYVSGERAGCLRRLLLGREVACNNCGSVGSFIIKSTRWSTTSPLALEVASNCANCGAGTTTPLSLRKRPGVAASTLPPLPILIHRSAWKVRSPKSEFRLTEFYEVHPSGR